VLALLVVGEGKPEGAAGVVCLSKVESQSTAEQTSYESFEDATRISNDKLKHFAAVKKIALGRMKNVEGDVVRDRAAKDEWKAKYKKEHMAAINVYELARSVLNQYNDMRKSASLNDARSQEAMAAYLKYKDMAIKAKDDAKSAAKSAALKQYQRMSAQYLKQYQSLQDKIKEELSNADVRMKKYKELSAQYKKLGIELKVTDTKVTGATKKYNDSNDKLRTQKAKYTHAAEQTKAASQQHAANAAKAAKHKEKWQTLKAESLRIKKKLKFFSEKARDYGKQKTALVAKLVKYRGMAFKFKEGAQEHLQKAEDEMKMRERYKDKYEAAKAAMEVYSASFKNGGCGLLPHQIAQLKAHKAKREKLKAQAAEAVQTAEEELKSAQEMREEAEAENTAGTKQTSKKQGRELREAKESDSSQPKVLATEDAFSLKASNAVGGSLLEQPPTLRMEMGAPDLSAASSLLQVGEDKENRRKSACDNDREVGTANFNAAEENKLFMERHGRAEEKHRKTSAQMKNGALSARNVLASVKLKLSVATKHEEKALQLRAAPCSALSAEEDWTQDHATTVGKQKGTTKSTKKQPKSD